MQHFNIESDHLGPPVLNGEYSASWKDGTYAYYRNGCFHRENGPAILFPSGTVRWVIDGNTYTFERFLSIANMSGEEKIILILKYRNTPCYE